MNPILLEIFFPDYKPPHEIVRQTYDRLFEAIRPIAPEISASAWKAWNEDRPVGPALADAIRAWGEKIRAEEHETQKKLDAIIQTQEKQLAQQAKDIQAAKKAMDDTNTLLAEIQEICIQKQKTIDDQNNLIVKKHDQLARLSGLPKDE